MNTVFLFDVDSTLTLPRLPMDPSFAERFEIWAETHPFYLISGSDWIKIKEQIPESVLTSAEGIFVCAGNELWEYSRADEPKGPYQSYNELVPKLIYKNEYAPSEELLSHIKNQIKYANWQSPIFGEQIEYRCGMINVSIIGRACPTEWRTKYAEWAKQDGELVRLANSINENFPEVQAVQGGQISLDICPVGKDKRQVLDYLDLSDRQIQFYGDKITSGNDKSLADEIAKRNCGVSFEVLNWEWTERLLGLTPAEKTDTIEDQDGTVSTGN